MASCRVQGKRFSLELHDTPSCIVLPDALARLECMDQVQAGRLSERGCRQELEVDLCSSLRFVATLAELSKINARSTKHRVLFGHLLKISLSYWCKTHLRLQ